MIIHAYGLLLNYSKFPKQVLKDGLASNKAEQFFCSFYQNRFYKELYSD